VGSENGIGNNEEKLDNTSEKPSLQDSQIVQQTPALHGTKSEYQLQEYLMSI
jgi:hypothetical protein